MKLNAEEDPCALLTTGKRNGGRFPPHRTPLKQALGLTPRIPIVARGRELLVIAEYDDALPLRVTDNLINLETYERILPHPLDFLTERRVPIKRDAVERDVNGNNVRLVVKGARQASDLGPGQHRTTVCERHLFDLHRNSNLFR